MERGGQIHDDVSRRKESLQGSSDRTFGLAFAAFFLILGAWPLVRGRDVRGWALALSAGLLVMALARPALLAPLNRLWTQFGLLLHALISPVVLGIVFYGTVTPIGLLMRIAGKDPLRLRFDPDAPTYWIERQPPGPAPDTMRQQF